MTLESRVSNPPQCGDGASRIFVWGAIHHLQEQRAKKYRGTYPQYRPHNNSSECNQLLLPRNNPLYIPLAEHAVAYMQLDSVQGWVPGWLQGLAAVLQNAPEILHHKAIPHAYACTCVSHISACHIPYPHNAFLHHRNMGITYRSFVPCCAQIPLSRTKLTPNHSL